MLAQVELEVFSCWDCGITFAAPQEWAREKFKEDECIKCPNGHDVQCCYVDDDAKAPALLEAAREENASLRRQLMQERHDHEQAEARARDARPATDAPEAVPDPAAHHPPVDESGWLLCPQCGRRYRTTPRLRTHLETKHEYSDDAAIAVVKRAIAAVGRSPRGGDHADA